jgi:hypothetical protein
MTQDCHQTGQLGVTRRARLAVGKMLRERWIDRLAAALGQIAVEQAVVLEVMGA